ncbi:alpha/beta hydrolase fold domain-containing protein [Streptomyces sp. HD]|uniref:alpha/beta hydrolase fold domain-containing protein n=1 Tax=Streptomyces sp. HD TaxID=3020892 RepID=UPI00232C9F90|nr:alpha/beta hydrolase fold domain-containing protein [Streptomyces sp. HD]MDC0770808.1 alpha/beta hydrolase fold domain-containing protein [Streptomyces sp. HD]
MPSDAFSLMKDIIKSGRMDASAKPAGLAAKRRQQADIAAMYRPVPGVLDEPLADLRDGSYLMTPDRPHEDLLILYIHGGGFRTGLAAIARPLAAHLALGTQARVVLPKYRLAPEDPYPAGLDDSVAAFEYAATLAPRVVVAGESAGANLAAAVLLLHAKAQQDTRALAGVLYSGVFDLRIERYASGSWVERRDTDLILAGADSAMTTDYIGDQRYDAPLISLLLADLHGLPPLFVQVSSAEMLLDDSLELVARAGVQVELEVWPEMTHAWQIAAGFLPEATEATARTAAFINRVAEGRVVDGAALLGGPAILDEV